MTRSNWMSIAVLCGVAVGGFRLGVAQNPPAKAGQRGGAVPAAAPKAAPAENPRIGPPGGAATALGGPDLRASVGITGIVVREGTMKALDRVQVELFQGDAVETDAGPPTAYRTEAVDRDGRFRLTDVRPGRYRLIASRDGFVHPSTDPRGARPLGDVIAILANARDIDVVVSMRPAPSIAGTVTAPIDAPLPAALVQAFRIRSTDKGPQLDLMASAVTGDRGDYRLLQISPGDYYIVASYSKPSAVGPPGVELNPNIAIHDEGFLPMYHPGVPTRGGARIVRVAASDVDGIDIALKEPATATKRGRAAVARPASIAGVVFRAAQVEERVTDARVELFGGPGTPLVTRTDGGGNFTFSNLDQGAYRLRVTRDGFLRQEYGADEPGVEGQPIVLSSGQQKNDVRFVLRTASGLSGFVADENWEPAPNVVVEALRPKYDALGNRFLDPAFFASTDDRGHYRLYWVDPGDYHIAAVAVEQATSTGTSAKPATAKDPPAVTAYAPVYYPGVADPVDVDPIHINPGDEGTGIDFRFIPGATVTVRGRIKAPAGENAVLVNLSPTGSIAAAVSRMGIATSGAFSIRGATPGAYIASAETPSGHRGFVRVDVRGQDVPDVTITLTPPVAVAGQMYVSGVAPSSMDGAEIRLLPLEVGLVPPSPAPVQPDGGFKLDKVKNGRYLVAVTGLPGESYMTAARVGDNNRILEEGVTLGAAGRPLEVAIATDGGRLGGTAVDAQGKPVARARIVLVPDANRDRPDLYRVAESDANGAFTLHGISPGGYKLFAWERIEPNAYLNAAFLHRFEDKGMAVSVASKASLNANVSVIPAPSK